MALHETPAPNDTKRRSPWLRFGLLGLLGIALYGGYSYLSTVGSQLKIGRDTTYITTPLKSDGKQVDYFAAWQQRVHPPELATEANGYRQVVEHLGGPPGAPPYHFQKLCAQLGLDWQAVPVDMTYEEPQDFLRRTLQDDAAANESDSRLQTPWTAEDLPVMEVWLLENGPALDLIGDAVAKDVFHIPSIRAGEDEALIELSMPGIQWVRSFARGLRARANYRIGKGDVEGAMKDIIACKRLGRHVRRDCMMIKMLVGIAIENVADSINIAGSPSHRPTQRQLELLQQQMNDLPTYPDFEQSLLYERFVSLDIVQLLAHGKPIADIFDEEIPRGRIDWNVVARRMNAHNDSLHAGQEMALVQNPLAALISRKVRSQMMADIFASIVVASPAGLGAVHRSTCSDHLRQISLAMLRYEIDHGTLPPAFTVDESGEPLHSWRVLLLPYLGQQELHDKIRLDEPWDSQHNRKFHIAEVEFYQCPAHALSAGRTRYAVVVGPDMPFQAGKGRPFSDFGPQSATMPLVVECKSDVCWMDPRQDVAQEMAYAGINSTEFANQRTRNSIASPHPGGANFGLRGGACQFISEAIDAEDFRALLRGEKLLPQ